jgi:hypothetical protein
VNIWGLGTFNLLFKKIFNPKRPPAELCMLPDISLQSSIPSPPDPSHVFNVLLVSRSCNEIVQYLTQEELMSIPQNHNQTMHLSGSVVIGPEGDAMQCHPHVVIPSLGCRASLGPLPSCDYPLPEYSTVIIISQYWGEGYFHFFIEGVPRLMDVDPSVYSNDLVHVHTNMRSHSIASHVLSLISSNLNPISGSVRANNVIIPPPTPCGGHKFSKRHMPSLRLSLQTKLIVKQPQHIVLVSRHGSRAIANHEELLREISQKFPVIVHQGSEPILDQLQMFSDAFLAIAPHGAGLSNVIVMQAKTAVIEILPNHMNACYALLAFNLGLRYSPYYDPDFTHENAVNVNVSYLADMASLLDTRVAPPHGLARHKSN